MPSSEPSSSALSRSEFSRRVDEHQQSLFAYLSRLGLRSATVDDVAQEAFLRAWRYRDRFDASRGQWNTWLFRIARNLAFSAMRREASDADLTEPEILERNAASTPEPSANAELLQKRMRLRRAIQQLNEDERDVLAMAYVQALSSTEAASIIGCEPGTFRVRLSRARARLTGLIEESV